MVKYSVGWETDESGWWFFGVSFLMIGTLINVNHRKENVFAFLKYHKAALIGIYKDIHIQYVCKLKALFHLI